MIFPITIQIITYNPISTIGTTPFEQSNHMRNAEGYFTAEGRG